MKSFWQFDYKIEPFLQGDLMVKITPRRKDTEELKHIL